MVSSTCLLVHVACFRHALLSVKDKLGYCICSAVAWGCTGGTGKIWWVATYVVTVQLEHTFPAALDKETIGHFHDVGLVHCCDLVPSIVTGILEGILRHPSTGHSCDDLHNHRVTLMLWFVTQGRLSQIVKADLQ